MANKNFEIKNGLTVAGTERITAAGAGSLTNLTLSGNLTVNGTTVTLDASTLQVADKNIVLNYHASNDTSSASGGAGITIQDAVNGTTDATILWDASDDEFDFSHGINIPNLKVSGGQGTDGQLLTSTGSGVAWEDAPASGPTFKAFGTSSIMVGDSTTGTINAADYNTGLGVDVFKYLTTGDKNTVLGFEAGMSLLTHNENTLIGYQAGKLLGNGAESWEAQRNTFIGAGAGRDVDEGSKNIAIGYEAMMSSTSTSTHDIAIGYQAMQYRASSIGDSIAIGVNAHRGVNGGNLNANRNVAVGSYTLQIVETYGQQNTAVGWYTGKGVTSGNSNTLIGSEAGEAVSTGQKNTLIGYRAGELITSGGFNVVLGSYDGNEGGLDIRTASNRVVISDGAGNIRMYIDNTGNVGIGTTAPSGILSIPATDTTTKPQIRFMTTGATNLADAALSTTDDSGGTNLLIGSNQYYSGGSIARFDTSRSGTAIDFGYTGRIKFFTGSGNAAPTERMQIDSEGNIGIGLTPKTDWHTSYPAIQIGQSSAFFANDAGDEVFMVQNARYTSGGWKYNSSGTAALFDMQSGNTRWRRAVSGSDNGAVSWSDSMMILGTNGNVGIGVTAPAHLGRTGSGKVLELAGDDCQVRLQNSILHHDNSGNTNLYIRNHYTTLGNDNNAKVTLEAGKIVFATSTGYTNRWQIDNNGHFTPAAQHTVDIGGVNAEVRNIYAQGLYIGGSAAVNKLDDYEFGGWTPVLQNVTTSSLSHYSLYTKIGRICHIHCKITATVTSLPGANFAISGLPFPAKDSSDSQQRALISIGGDTQNVGSYGNGRAHFRTNGSQLQGVWLNSGSTAYWNYNSMDHTTFEIHVHGHYTV